MWCVDVLCKRTLLWKRTLHSFRSSYRSFTDLTSSIHAISCHFIYLLLFRTCNSHVIIDDVLYLGKKSKINSFWGWYLWICNMSAGPDRAEKKFKFQFVETWFCDTILFQLARVVWLIFFSHVTYEKMECLCSHYDVFSWFGYFSFTYTFFHLITQNDDDFDRHSSFYGTKFDVVLSL